ALKKYAELIVNVGLNLQPGQRLLIKGDALVTNGVSIHVAPLVRLIALSAYQRGARLVDVIWGDDQLQLARFQHAPRDSFEEYPSWQTDGALECARRGDARLVILADDPGLFDGQDPDLVAAYQKVALKHARPAADYAARNAMNWTVVAAPVPGWAVKVFPDLPPQAAEARLWDTIFEICRLKKADPISAWQEHVQQLSARCSYLNHKQYTALKLIGPGTDLSVGLPRGHIWEGIRATSQAGISFIGNLPTEEIFTLPHKDKTEGIVTASMPLSRGGTLLKNFSLSFAQGRVVNVSADKGESALRKLIETDEGASRLGEVALVPHSSPISQSGILFHNDLIDENAASHIALGAAYRFNLEGGTGMSDAEFAAAGGNDSLVHADFMIGSAQMDVDGLKKDGSAEPVMRAGEWAFEV
ncbi:MAG: aminopeptidase, partial [Anaerolineales bacterium]